VTRERKEEGLRRSVDGICLVIISLALVGCGFKTTPRPAAATVPGDIAIVEAHAFPDRVVLKWEAPLSNVDGSLMKDLSGFKVYRSERRVGEECDNCQEDRKLYANVDSQKPTNAIFKGREVTYSDTDASPGNVYVYTVSTYNLKGREGAQSPEVTVPLDDFPPPPEGLMAHSENDGVGLEWNAPPRPAGIRGYRIYRGESDSPEDMQQIGGTKWAETSFKDKDAEKDKVYYYRVRSLKMNRGIPYESRPSEPERVRMAAAQVQSPENVNTAPGQDGIRVYWDPVKLSSGEVRYNIYRSESGTMFLKANIEPLTNPWFIDKDVKSGRTYRYAVTSFPATKPDEESSRTASEALEFKP
jgi:uncharacterized protein